MIELTQNLLKELFDYQDGELYWKVARSNKKSGDRAGTIQSTEYQQVSINNKLYLTHRLIFLYHHGYLPEFLDHIDGDPSNNEVNNLRETTKSQNGMNAKKLKSMNGKPTSSKYKGVSWHKNAKKWLSHITIDGKIKHLGYFTSEIEAAKAYDRAAIETFGKFAKLNEN